MKMLISGFVRRHFITKTRHFLLINGHFVCNRWPLKQEFEFPEVKLGFIEVNRGNFITKMLLNHSISGYFVLNGRDFVSGRRHIQQEIGLLIEKNSTSCR
jgi:hypothetical protein